MAQGFSLKDQLFNAEKVAFLGRCFAPHVAGFRSGAFEAEVLERFPELELKARIAWIADCLARHVPGSLSEIAAPLRAALPPPLDPTLSDDDFGDFIFAPLGEWVAALSTDVADRDLGLDLLEEITQRFSMEWAIRPFLRNWPEDTLARMQAWTAHENYHVRRLATEGARPRLPWGEAVGLPVAATVPILDQLYADPTRYVTRSVANHLNDMAKKDPDLVLDCLARWKTDARQTPAELRWITGHALRGLVKAGHEGAMTALGFHPDLAVEAHLDLPQSVRIGEKLAFDCTLYGAADAGVLVDYRITFCRPGGKSSVKVFKLKQGQLKQGILALSKSHPLKANATTFTLVPGLHELEILVNGQVRASGRFDLME